MNGDEISVNSLEHELSYKKVSEEKENIQKTPNHNETSHWNICHVFSILAVSVLFLACITLIPRTNSIFHQSYWYELNFCVSAFMILPTAGFALDIATYSNEASILTFWILFKMYSWLIVLWIVPYLIAYLVWC